MVCIELNAQMVKRIKRRMCRFDTAIGTFLKFFVTLGFVMLLGIGCVSASTLVVSKTSPACTSGDEYFTSIQAAVDSANGGAEIVVCPGTYVENIEVIRAVYLHPYAGSTNTIIEAKKATDDVITVTANKVAISGFTIRNSEANGIYLDAVEGCNLSGNNIYSTRIGIYLFSSDGNKIGHNAVNLNDDSGIFLESSNDNLIVNNTANSNKQYHGIELSTSNNNAIIGNKVYNNFDSGIALFESSNNNTITGNIANLNNNGGIYLESSHNNSIWNNTANSNKQHDGITLLSSNKNAILGNNVYNNFDSGIALFESSNNNRIKNNTVCENGVLGIMLQDWSSGNEVSNNIVNKNLGGILLSRSDTNIIKGNTCENNTLGIMLQDWSSGNEVSNNIVNKNSMGINVQFESNNNVIKDNTACENEVEGIQLEDSSNNEVSNNIANKNLGGIIVLNKLAANNVITDNTACENGDVGIQLQETSMNEVCNNVANKNFKGIALIRSNDNIIKNNIANENKRVGIKIEDSSKNNVSNNIVNKGVEYICLTRSNFTKIQNNNVGKSKISISMPILESFFNYFDHNYWSDYTGEDKDKDGIGDEPYEIGGAYKDYHPYMNYSGWLNVVVTPEFWYFFAKKGDVIYKNFRIENRLNRPTNVEVLLDKNLDFEADHYVTEISKKTFSLAPKSIQIITLQLNTTNLEGYILRTIIFKTEDYTKTTLVNGFVQPKIHSVKIEGVDFHRNVVKGQINPFKVILRNYGNKDEFDVKLRMGSEKVSSTIYLNETETRTIPFKIDTSNMPLGINKGQVVVLKDERLDYLNLTMFVASKREASTLIVTNLKRMEEKWENDRVSELKEKILELCFHPTVNGIIVSVEHETNCSKPYEQWDNDKAPEKANEIAKAIKSSIDSKIGEYPNIEYVVIVGDDRIIPYYRITDNTDKPFGLESWHTEDHYLKVNKDSTVGSAIHNKMFFTDNIYATDRAMEMKTADVTIPELFVPDMPIGRLVESPEDISTVIEAYYQRESVNPDKIFVTGYHFMEDSAWYCRSLLKKRLKSEPKIMVNVTPDYSKNIMAELLNTSNNLVFVFQHADHNQFYIYGDREINITSENIAQSVADLNSSIVCSLGCHSGLNVPPNASIDDFDLAQAFAQKGVLAYIAPTGYSIGSCWTRTAHELLISYFTKYLCEGKEVGTALTLAKQEYWATNYDFNYFDEQVLETTVLYGLPMTRVDIPHPATSGNESERTIKCLERSTTERPDSIVIRPNYTLMSVFGNLYHYYITSGEELLSDPRKPVQPKEIRTFNPTSTKMLHGAVMTGGKYKILKGFTPLIEKPQQSPGQELEPVPIELDRWYPAPLFKINTISHYRTPMVSRQYMIIVTGQYKGGTMGTERLYDELSFDLYYASPEEETIPPIIEPRTDPTKNNGTINISVNASDESGIQKVLVTYTDGKGEWKSKDLNKTGELWTCEIAISEISEFFVQAVDNAGNAAVGEQREIRA